MNITFKATTGCVEFKIQMPPSNALTNTHTNVCIMHQFLLGLFPFFNKGCQKSLPILCTIFTLLQM